jgi:hypothetical protein
MRTRRHKINFAGIAARVARGDSFVNVGDIASARFYQVAADAGDGPAALRLGATFDPSFLTRAGRRDVPGNAELAAFWYIRAHHLANAAERLKTLDQQRVVEPRTPPTELGYD